MLVLPFNLTYEMGQIDDIMEDIEEKIDELGCLYLMDISKIEKILQKHLEAQKKARVCENCGEEGLCGCAVESQIEPQKKEEEGIEAENILYDYGFQAGRLYEKQHPSDKKAEDSVEYGLGYAKGFVEGQEYYRLADRLLKKEPQQEAKIL